MNSYIRTAATCLAALSLSACSVTCEDSGELPEVEVTEGRMPKADIDTAEIDVKTKKTEVAVPDIDIRTKKKTIEVPDVDVKMPDEDHDG